MLTVKDIAWFSLFHPFSLMIDQVESLIPQSTPYLACTATVTRSIREEVVKSLEMHECDFVSTSPDRSNIFYEVHIRTEIRQDMESLVKSLKENKAKASRVIVYCRSLNTCRSICPFS